jgi:hypothetical protein
VSRAIVVSANGPICAALYGEVASTMERYVARHHRAIEVVSEPSAWFCKLCSRRAWSFWDDSRLSDEGRSSLRFTQPGRTFPLPAKCRVVSVSLGVGRSSRFAGRGTSQ